MVWKTLVTHKGKENKYKDEGDEQNKNLMDEQNKNLMEIIHYEVNHMDLQE